ncbi:MAG: hypothetical protein ACOC7K_01450 [bacterium]
MKPTVVFKETWPMGVVLLLLMVAFPVPRLVRAAGPPRAAKRPSFSQVERVVKSALAEREGYRPKDLINRSDVERVLKALAESGWRPSDHEKLLDETLSEDNPLVQILGTKPGIKFMRKVKGYELIYDRMDRVCRVRDGKRMLADMSKLPDGERYAKMERPAGVPGFLELLPKRSSGKVRSIEDYKKPTGRIYTEKQLLKRLKQSYQENAKGDCEQGDGATEAR